MIAQITIDLKTKLVSSADEDVTINSVELDNDTLIIEISKPDPQLEQAWQQ